MTTTSPEASPDATLSAWRDAECGISPETGSLKLGWLYTVITAGALPVASPYFLLSTLLQYLRVLYVKVRSSAATYGSDTTLGFDLVASLVIIPLAGLISTTGVSVALFMLSEEDRVTWQSSGWIVLIGTVLITIKLIWLTARTLSRHKSGAEVLVFEENVEVEAAIDQLREWRGNRVPGYLPGRFKAADTLAMEAVVKDIGTVEAPRLRQALACLAAHRVDRLQLIVIAVGGVGWIICPLLWRPDTYRWWLMALIILVAYALLALSLGVTVQSLYFDRLRWLKRSWVLWKRKAAPEQPEVASGSTLTVLTGQVAELADKVDTLQQLLAERKNGHPRMWVPWKARSGSSRAGAGNRR
ncbi:hypothetical protein GCM10027451_27900 [Geodermatophilus aquaeductus]|uniref:hypothetical protein n=1 Tax=Geodermatophilus aquaeductus TaxID=1564161 RepID=UPI001157BB1A|nr:hypothetical protein [Geodermatophilus aquaeductus]